jgi:CIC family chloride channel protein
MLEPFTLRAAIPDLEDRSLTVTALKEVAVPLREPRGRIPATVRPPGWNRRWARRLVSRAFKLMTPFLRRFSRPTTRWWRLLTIGALVGVLGGLAAAALEAGLHLGVNALVGNFLHLGGPDTLRFEWAVLLLPALGGLVSGLVVHWACPDAFGHGTDMLTRAFHRRMGELPLKGPLIKAGAAVGVISCGGSAGPEGPTAALGAALGSTLGQMFHLTPQERRVMLVAGCAAGVGAIFQCPLGGALFAAGVLYREPEFESDAIVPGFVASVLGYSTFMLCGQTGQHMLIGAEHLRFQSPWELVPYALLGPLCGAFSILFSLSMRTVEHRLLPLSRLPRWLAPGFGGLAAGALACLLPQVMDGQYRFIQNALDGVPLYGGAEVANWWGWAAFFGGVAVVKCLATALTVGSGASGGLLGPAVFIGGVVGAFLGAVCEAVAPETFPDELRVALIPVGMGGVLAASMRTPLAAIVMVTEMTGSYGLIVPLMLVCVSAYVVGRPWGLNEEQVRSASESPAHVGDAVIHILESLRVEQVMERRWTPTARPEEPLDALVKKITPGTRPVFAVTDGERLVGLISVPDIHRIVSEPGLSEAIIAADLMTERLATVTPDDDLYHAVNVFRRENHDVLPVVARGPHRRWVGMLTRRKVFETVRRGIEETQRLMFLEHVGLEAMDREGQLQQLVMGIAPARTDLVQRLLVPLQAVGLSLREADFRRQFGAQVIAIEEPDGTIRCPPPLDMPLRTGQRLLAVVWQETTGQDARETVEEVQDRDDAEHHEERHDGT